MKDRVRFKNPPVVEVVCGVLFALPRPLKGAEVGLFWQQIAKDFPELREAPPLASIVEQFDDATVQEDGAQLLSMPPLRRTWMLSSDGHHLVQVQDDRFLFNWKKAADETVHDRLHGRDQHQADYPSYDHVIERFNHHLRGFQGFLTSRQAGAMQFQQYELTYVNHVGSWNGLKVVPMAAALVDQSREIGRERFLPEPAGFQWVTTYDLPDGMGRLHVNAQRARLQRTGEIILRLDLTARGLPTDTSEAGRVKWFDLAHEWITHGFADVTSKKLQTEIWERQS